MVNALDNLERKCSKKTFKSVFQSITFDNGSEFQDFYSMERSCFNDKENETKFILLMLKDHASAEVTKIVIGCIENTFLKEHTLI